MSETHGVASAKAQIDVEALLAPIPGDSPGGVDPTAARLYDEIEQFRKTDDPNGALGELKEGQARVADWRKVLAISSNAIATKSKDLGLAFYIAESLTKQAGLAGMRDGFRLFHELHQRFWLDMYPRIVEDDVEARTVWLERLDRVFQQSVADVPFTQVRDEKAHTFWEWQDSQIQTERASRNPNAEEKKKAIRVATEKKDELGNAIAKTARPFYDHLQTEINLCVEVCEQFRNVVEKRLEEEAGSKQLEELPKFFYTRKALEEFATLVDQILSTKEPLTADKPESTPDPSGSVGLEQVQLPVIRTGVLTREDAVKGLVVIANFLQRTEPHSPVSYLVERAIRWSRLSLTELLEELLHDAGALGRVKETLGILGK